MAANLSKPALIFKNRLLSFDQDIELVDIIVKANKEKDLLKSDINIFSHLDTKKHPYISSKQPTDASRKIIVNHLRKTVYSSYIKDIYEELTTYLKSLLFESSKLLEDRGSVCRLIGENKITFSAIDVLQYKDIESLFQKIAEEIIQSLENERSTKQLIKKTCNKLGLNVKEDIIEAALPYLELRHKLVHTNGLADREFMETFKVFQYTDKNEIILNYQIICKARDCILKLVYCTVDIQQNSTCLYSHSMV